jgi:phosphocarrier protein
MKTLCITLENGSGLHARPASQLTECVQKFESEIKLKKDDDFYNPRSMMSLLSMGADKGTTLEFTIEGSDEVSAYEAIKKLMEQTIE